MRVCILCTVNLCFADMFATLIVCKSVFVQTSMLEHLLDTFTECFTNLKLSLKSTLRS